MSIYNDEIDWDSETGYNTNDEIICPYCEHVHQYDWDGGGLYHESPEPKTCDKCDKKFYWQSVTTYAFESYKVIED